MLKSIKGYDLNDLFDEKKDRIDCWLTADDAQKIGLIKKVVPLTPVNQNNMARAVAMAYNPAAKMPKATAATAVNKQNVKMTADELKQSDPECYKAVFAAGASSGVTAYKKQCSEALDIAEDEMPEPDPECGCSPKKAKSKAKAITDEQINAAVEAKLKEYGINAIASAQPAQTAQANATMFAQKPVAGTEKTPEQLAQEKVIAETEAKLKDIVNGKAQ